MQNMDSRSLQKSGINVFHYFTIITSKIPLLFSEFLFINLIIPTEEKNLTYPGSLKTEFV